ncbi:MAG: DEAD/DEAH box helicase [Paracoccaceae bacterium]
MKKALQDALDERGYSTLTAVQEAVLHPDLIGSDLLVSAQTGSGKTLGFGLAIAPTLLGDAETFDAPIFPAALVLAPTRELAMQVKRELSWLYAKANAVIASCVGGMDMRDERRNLSRGAHIVVATPGRLRDHLERGSIDLNGLRAVVLDEADEMLDLGFREDLEFILGEAPEERQTLMFSATVPRSIAALAKSYQKDAVRVSTTAEKTQHADIEYQAMSVAGRDAENAIINVLRYFEAPNALVFANTRAMVNRLTTRLSNRGFSVVALSGELSQNERTHALQAMRDGRARVCVATDVAARGIDLPNLDLVVHAELPTNHETLLHRSGRTGRAGRKGISVMIVPPSVRRKAERILGAAKLQANWGSAPSADAVRARDEERMLADPVWEAEVTENEREIVDQLVGRFSADQLAARFLRLLGTKQSAPEELAEFDNKPKQRPEFGPSAWFSVSGGHSKRAEPRRLIPMLCKAGGISSQDIGAIRIANQESFIEIRESSVPAFLDAIGPEMTVEDGASLTRVDAPPTETGSPRPPREPRSRDRKPAKHRPSNQWNPDTSPDKSPASDADTPRSPQPAKSRPKTKAKTGPKGPPPPKGKANSKKNKARKLASKNAKAGRKAEYAPGRKGV